MTTDSILKNATDEELGLAVFENLYDLFRAMATDLPEGQLMEGEKLSRHLTFPTNPMFKGVWKTLLTENEADAAIDETIAWFKQQDAPYFFWWTGGDAAPKDLEERLAKRGLISMAQQTQELAKGILSTEHGSPCMVAELSRMNETVLDQVLMGLSPEKSRAKQSYTISKKYLSKPMRSLNGPGRHGWMPLSRSASEKRPGEYSLDI